MAADEIRKREFVVGKAAISTTTADADWSPMPSEPLAREFFRKVVDESAGITKNARIVPVDGPYLPIPSIDMTRKLAVGLAETSLLASTGDQSGITFAGRNLVPENFRMMLQVSELTFQEINLEKYGIDQTLTEMLVQECANAIEEMASRSVAGGANPSGYGTGHLTVMDGFPELFGDGNVYDHAGGDINTVLFREMWLSIPTKWRGPSKKAWRFYVHDDVMTMLHDLVANRPTGGGDRWLESEDGITTPFGVPCVSCNWLDTELAGTLTRSKSSAKYTHVLLAQPSNLFVGYRPKMRVLVHPNDEMNLKNINIYGEVGFQIQNPAAVVIGKNVTVDVTY